MRTFHMYKQNVGIKDCKKQQQQPKKKPNNSVTS